MDMDVDRESEMNLSCKELRVLPLYEFRLGRKATEAARNICSMMGEDTLPIRTAQHCFNRFNSGNFELNDSQHSGRPLEVDVGVLKQLIEEDPTLTTYCLAERLGCSHTTVETYLSELDKTWKYGAWITPQFSPHQLQLRVGTCMAVMTSHRNYQWLHNLITGDEKCHAHEEASMAGNWINR